MTPNRQEAAPTPAERHWRRTKKLTVQLLAVWGGVTFAAIFFARELSAVTVFGWPLSFYLVAQGVPLVYVLIGGVYAWRMRILDHECQGGRDGG